MKNKTLTLLVILLSSITNAQTSRLVKQLGGFGVNVYNLRCQTDSTITVSQCKVYISPSGNYIWNSSGIYTDTLINAASCDSIITVNLTINSSTSTISPTACGSYLSPGGLFIWTTSGTYHDTIPNAVGCDSIMIINLTIDTVDVGVTVSASSPTFTANQTGASYQWIDCHTGYSPIAGETSQTFDPTFLSEYAVIVTMGSCSDTSDCYSIPDGISENSFGSNIFIYPNPTSGNFMIDMGMSHQNVSVTITNAVGQEVLNSFYTTNNKIDIHLNNESGIYFIHLKADGHKTAFLKLVKQ